MGYINRAGLQNRSVRIERQAVGKTKLKSAAEGTPFFLAYRTNLEKRWNTPERVPIRSGIIHDDDISCLHRATRCHSKATSVPLRKGGYEATE